MYLGQGEDKDFFEQFLERLLEKLDRKWGDESIAILELEYFEKLGFF